MAVIHYLDPLNQLAAVAAVHSMCGLMDATVVQEEAVRQDHHLHLSEVVEVQLAVKEMQVHLVHGMHQILVVVAAVMDPLVLSEHLPMAVLVEAEHQIQSLESVLIL